MKTYAVLYQSIMSKDDVETKNQNQGIKITDDMIRGYCKHMNYELIDIQKISFSYIQPDGSKAANLKAAAAPGYIFGQVSGETDE